jgi:hypothetical protein
MSRIYNCLPSQILRIEDDYTAYCFDEACALIMSKIDNDEKPKFKKIKEKQKNQVKKKARMLPSEIYKKFDKQ